MNEAKNRQDFYPLDATLTKKSARYSSNSNLTNYYIDLPNTQSSGGNLNVGVLLALISICFYRIRSLTRLAVALAIFPTLGQAATFNYTMGVELAQGDFDFSDRDFKNIGLLEDSLTLSEQKTYDITEPSLYFSMGWKNWAILVRKLDLGDFSYESNRFDLGISETTKIDGELDTLSLGVRHENAFNNGLSLIKEAGLVSWESNYNLAVTANNQLLSRGIGERDGTEPYINLGVGYQINNHFKTSLNYRLIFEINETAFGSKNSDQDLLALDIVYRNSFEIKPSKFQGSDDEWRFGVKLGSIRQKRDEFDNGNTAGLVVQKDTGSKTGFELYYLQGQGSGSSYYYIPDWKSKNLDFLFTYRLGGLYYTKLKYGFGYGRAEIGSKSSSDTGLVLGVSFGRAINEHLIEVEAVVIDQDAISFTVNFLY